MCIHHCLSFASGSPAQTTHERLITEICFWEGLSGSFSHPCLQTGLALAAHTLPRSKGWHFLPPMAIFAARARNMVSHLKCQFVGL